MSMGKMNGTFTSGTRGGAPCSDTVREPSLLDLSVTKMLISHIKKAIKGAIA